MGSKNLPYVPSRLPVKPFSGIALVGENPSTEEVKKGEPFVGPAGKKLSEVLKKAGIERDACYIGNICRYKPPSGGFEWLETFAPELIEEGIMELKKDLLKLRPNVIVALGDVPLRYLTSRRGISKWRGSILSVEIEGTVFKLIPTFHPASVLRTYQNIFIMGVDFKKIKEESKIPQVILPQREFVIKPSLKEIRDYFKLLISLEGSCVACDIEVVKRTGILLCVGFSHSKDFALTIPFFYGNSPYWGRGEEVEVRRLIAELLSNASVKTVFHNSVFDTYILAKYHKTPVTNLWFDTLVAMHCCYPHLPKDLGFVSSLFTREPYYKDDSPEWSSVSIVDWDQLLVYNCKDVSVTRELVDALSKEIKELGVEEVFKEEMENVRCAINMQLMGIRVNKAFREEKVRELEEKEKLATELIREATGKDVNYNSPKQVMELLYRDLKLRPITKKNGKASSDEYSLLELYREFRHPVLKHILMGRGATKLKSFFKSNLDTDGRFKCTHKPFATVSGRWATESTHDGIGANCQNLPHDARGQIIADEGKVLVEIDGKQTEARIVGYEAECSAQIAIFEDPEGDIHTENCMRMFGLSREYILTVDKKQPHGKRYITKKAVHGANYLLTGTRLSKEILKETEGELFISPEECQKYIDAYFELYPEIRENYQNRIISTVLKTRMLRNHFGRVMFFWDSFDYQESREKQFREACAFLAQSSCADLINRVLNTISRRFPDEVDILIHTHDGILMQVDEDKFDILLPKIVECFMIPVKIHGIDRYIPVEVSAGKAWKLDMKEVKVKV